MFCVNCGKDIPENSYICPYCKFVLNKDYEQTLVDISEIVTGNMKKMVQ